MRRDGNGRTDARSAFLPDVLIQKYPLLSDEEFLDLFDQYWIGFVEYRDKIVLHSSAIALKVAFRYSHSGVPREDLVQEGLGILRHRGVPGFDPTRGASWPTYATFWLRYAMRQLVGATRVGLAFRLPSHESDRRAFIARIQTQCATTYGRNLTGEELLAEIRRIVEARVKRRFVAEHHRDPSQEELAKKLRANARYRLTAKQVDEQLALAARRTVELDAFAYDGSGESIVERTADTSMPEKAMELNVSLRSVEVTQREILDAVALLPARDQDILRLRYGLDGEDPKTLQDVSEIIDISRERVRQLETLASRIVARRVDRSWEFVVRAFMSIAERAEPPESGTSGMADVTADELDGLFRILCQHAVDRDRAGIFYVVRPAVTIAARTRIQRGAASRLVASMIDAGWLERLNGNDAVLIRRTDALQHARELMRCECLSSNLDQCIPPRFRRGGRIRKLRTDDG